MYDMEILFPNRKKFRLQNYDYRTNGAYFITICSFSKKCIFGEIISGVDCDCPINQDNPCRDAEANKIRLCGCPKIKYTHLGKIAIEKIKFIEEKYKIKVDKFVVMPNHIHAIITIQDLHTHGHPQGASLQEIVGSYKSYVSIEYLRICKEKNIQMGEIWQRSFHDHVIRNERSYQKIWQYIDTNIIKWELDCYNPQSM